MNIKKVTILTLSMLISSVCLGVINSKVKIGVLGTIFKPDRMYVNSIFLYICQGAKVSIFNKNSLKLINHFGKIGAGPGEFIPGFRGIKLNIYEKFIFINNRYHIFYFSRHGKLLKQKRAPYFLNNIMPVKDRFVASRRKFEGNKKVFYTINIYDEKFNFLRNIYQKKDKYFLKNKYNYYPDNAKVVIYNNKIFLFKGTDFLTVDVFGDRLEKLSSFKINVPRIKTTRAIKNRVIKYYKYIRSWWRMKDVLAFPRYMPLIKSVRIKDDLIYLETFKRKDKTVEYIILNIDGKILQKVNLETFGFYSFFEIPFDFNDKKFFSILSNEKNETWELFQRSLF